MTMTRIALVGDFNPEVVAHQAINRSLALARDVMGHAFEPVWLGTAKIRPGDEPLFRGFSGVWCVPASPYQNTGGALWAIEYARTRPLPFLGTCGGFQHAILEYARNVLGLAAAQHQELELGTKFPLLHRLSCSLVEKSQRVVPTARGRFAAIVGADASDEGFRCNFGLNAAYEPLFQNSSLEVTARSVEGEVRVVELREHPFFLGALFQPERRALRGELHPIIRAFLQAAQSVQPAP